MAHGFTKRIQSPYFATGNPDTEEMTTLYAPGMLGCVAEFDQGGISGPANLCSYQLVKQSGDSAAGVVGQVFRWASKAAYTVAFSADTQTLAGIGRIAAGAASSYIWIGKRGDMSVKFIDAPTVAVAAGLPVVDSLATDGKADCLAQSNTQAAFPLIGVALGAQDGTSKLASVRVNIPDMY